MHEGGGVCELHGRRGWGEPVEVIDANLRGKEHKGRPDALAAGRKQVGHRAGNHLWIGVDQLAQAGLDRCEVIGHRTEKIGDDGYVVCFSQICTSCARMRSPNRWAAIRSKCWGTAVTRISCGGESPAARRRE